MVCVLALAPRTVPPQTGHLFPQPAPEPVARTYAPQSTTATLQTSVAQAKRAIGGMRKRGTVSARGPDDAIMPEDITSRGYQRVRATCAVGCSGSSLRAIARRLQ